MKFLFIALLLIPNLAFGRNKNLDTPTRQIQDINARQAAGGLSANESRQLQEQKAGAINQIETIGNSDPKDTETQLDVSRSLASVSEAPRAVPFAERGLKLAEESRDPKMLRDALLVGSEVYYKAGNYDLARERAQRILKTNPKDKDALALYMQVKDRGAASVSSGKGGATTANAGGASQPAQTPAQPQAAQTPRTPDVAMTSASSLEVQKQLELGASRMKLDPKDALKYFDAAVAADPKNAKAKAQRSGARLEAGDYNGALADAEEAIALDPKLGVAYAARGAAHRALGKAEADLVADYMTAAKLDGRFLNDYKTALLRAGGGTWGAQTPQAGDKPAAERGGVARLLGGAPAGWTRYAMFAVALAVFGGLLVPLVLKRRRSDEDGFPPR